MRIFTRLLNGLLASPRRAIIVELALVVLCGGLLALAFMGLRD